MFILYSQSAVTIWSLAVLDPLNLVGLNFVVLCMQIWSFCRTQVMVHPRVRLYRSWCKFELAWIKSTICPRAVTLHVHDKMFNSEGFILMHLPSLPVLCSKIRIIRCIQTSGCLTEAHVHTLLLVSCSPLYLVCIAASQRFWSALQPWAPQKPGKKISLLWLIKHEHPVVLSLPSHAVLHTPPFAFPLTQSVTAPSDSSDGLMKVMQMCSVCSAIFLHPSTSCLFNTQ